MTKETTLKIKLINVAIDSTTILIYCKLFGVINWSWWWLFAASWCTLIIIPLCVYCGYVYFTVNKN